MKIQMNNFMNNFIFKCPTKVVFGVNQALNLDSILAPQKWKKIFIVTDKVIEATLTFQAIVEKLEADGYECFVYSDTVADPPIEVCDKAAEVLKKSNSDAVLAIGGGSSIDTAKAMGMLATNEGSIRDYLFGGTKTVTNKPLPLICIPTTAGSGSEVTASSVITDTQNDIKLSVTHEFLTPLYAVVDPVMHKGMPPIITASTGMDALTHAIEAYVSLNANILSDAYAEKAMVLISENIRTATFNPENITARSNMALASLMAATAFVNGGLGAVHGIAQAMGGIAHTPHGIANSLLLPYVMEMNLPGNIEKFANIARMLGCKIEGLSKRDQAELAVEAVSQMVIDLRIPRKLTEVKVTKEMFPVIVKGTMEYRLLAVNPVKVREEDVYAILNKAYD